VIEIRKAVDADKTAIWQIIKAVIAGDDTYVFPSNTPKEEMMAYWFSPEKYNYVALEDGIVVGTFWLKANQPGLGSHIANAAYMVSPNAAGRASDGRWPSFRSRKLAGWDLLLCSSTSSSRAIPLP